MTAKNKIRRSTGEKIFDTANAIFLVLLCAIMVLPMIHVISVSFSAGPETLKGGFFFYPKGFSLDGYATVFKDASLLRSYANTVIYSVGGTAITLFFTALTAYPLSVPGFCLKKFVTIFLTLTMFIGGGMIPTYMLIRSMKLINNPLVMMVPFCVGAYNVILFRTFFTGIPESLREAAIIDGAGEMRILFQMILPNSMAIFATIGLFTFVGKWNEWFSALLYLNEESLYPVQMVLRKLLNNTTSVASMDAATRAMFSSNKVTGQNIRMASIVITIIPVLCIYPFLQKHFAKGALVGTIKG